MNGNAFSNINCEATTTPPPPDPKLVRI